MQKARFFGVALMAASTFALAACGGEKTTSSSSTSGARQTAAATNRPPAAFSQCAVCHAVKPDAPAMIGPNLYGIVGRQAARQEGFAYSRALQNADFVWDEETLAKFIENPQGFVKGNRMAFVGERQAERRDAIIEFLKTAQ
ncbi:MAG: c-type cytochrome [Pseudomonadota bacterium]